MSDHSRGEGQDDGVAPFRPPPVLLGGEPAAWPSALVESETRGSGHDKACRLSRSWMHAKVSLTVALFTCMRSCLLTVTLVSAGGLDA